QVFRIYAQRDARIVHGLILAFTGSKAANEVRKIDAVGAVLLLVNDGDIRVHLQLFLEPPRCLVDLSRSTTRQVFLRMQEDDLVLVRGMRELVMAAFDTDDAPALSHQSGHDLAAVSQHIGHRYTHHYLDTQAAPAGNGRIRQRLRFDAMSGAATCG